MNIEFTTNFSIVVQIIACIIGIHGIFIELPEKHKILYSILIIESIVQVIEIFFYIFFIRTMIKSSLSDIATIRYYDWFLTTPIMLFSTIAYFKYNQMILENQEKPLTLKDFISENSKNIIIIFVLNFLMLLCGYLGETKVIDNSLAIFIGFIFFAMIFYIIYQEYAVPSQQYQMYYLMTFIWALYGVAAMLSDENKNNMINMLDLAAKNFFAFYIYYVIQNISNT